MQMGSGFDMLDGVRVLDLTTSIAGPYATMLLADMGAQVIKVERPGVGDDARGWGPPFLDDESLWFLSINRNKKSLAIDYTKPGGYEVLADLVRKSDVVAVNQVTSSAKKLGIDASALQAIRPDIVYVSITGFGLDGERANWACYDLIAEGYSGVMDLTGEPDSNPQKIGAPAADMLAGQDAAFATLAALFSRVKTKRGRVIDIALVDSMVRFLTCRIVSYLGSGEVPCRSGGKDSVIAVYQAFETADLPITIGLGNDAIWRRFWLAVGEPDYLERPGMESNATRRAHRAMIVADIQQLLKKRRRAEWLELFAGARVPAGPINRIDEVTIDRCLRDRGLFYQLRTDGGRSIPQVGTGLRVDGMSNHPRSAPPLLGADTRTVLADVLNYEESFIHSLAEDGII